MTKREIKPHKGGRTARLYGCRIKPEASEQLKEILASRGISLADWIEEKVKEDIRRIVMSNILTEDERNTIRYAKRKAEEGFPGHFPEQAEEPESLKSRLRTACSWIRALVDIIEAVEARTVPVPGVNLWMLKELVENVDVVETMPTGGRWCQACGSEVETGHGGPDRHEDGCPYDAITRLIDQSSED